MPGKTPANRLAATALAVLAAAWSAAAAAQPSGATVVYGNAQFQQLGRSLLVTTQDGAGSKHSVIDWRSFSVPGGSVTHFLQPGVDSTSINRVTGGRPSEIFGTLSSNGRLVLVNPSGIAVGTGAVVDTAGFTASALGMSDADAFAGRMRFAAGHGKADVDVKGRILARNGNIVLLGTDVQVDKEAVVSSPSGSVILAAGQRVALTGRGLEGIVLEVTSPSDKVVNLGRLEGDAVGLFASQLKHTGVIQAQHVILAGDKVRLEKGGKDKDQGENGHGNGNSSGSGSGSDNEGSGGGSSGGGSSRPGNDVQDPDLAGAIDIAPPPANQSRDVGGSPSGSQGAASEGQDAPALIVAMQAGAAQAVDSVTQETASVRPPELPRDKPFTRRRPPADDVQQCTR